MVLTGNAPQLPFLLLLYYYSHDRKSSLPEDHPDLLELVNH